MIFQLDTANKTIQVKEDINLGELYAYLDNFLPGEAWKEYTLKIGPIQYWQNPITIEPIKPLTNPWSNPNPTVPNQPSPYTNPFPPYPWTIHYESSAKTLGTLFNIQTTH